MANCVDNNNPNKESCGNVRRLFVDQEEKSYSLTQRRRVKDYTTVGSTEIIIRLRERDLSIETQRDFDFMNPEACQHQTDNGAYLIHDGITSVVTATFNEHFKAIDSQLIYLDIRNNIAAWHETEILMNFSQTSTDNILWNQYGTTFLLHDFHFNDLPYTVSSRTKLLLRGEVITLYTHTHNFSAGELHIAMPPTSGTPQGDVPENYYLVQDNWYEDGGPDLYYPEWLRGLVQDETQDLADRDEHRRLIHDGGEPYNGTASPPAYPLCSPFPQGSWAVDNLGNIFISQLHPGGVYNRLVDSGGVEVDIIALTEMSDKGDNPVFYPIAPV